MSRIGLCIICACSVSQVCARYVIELGLRVKTVVGWIICQVLVCARSVIVIGLS